MLGASAEQADRSAIEPAGAVVMNYHEIGGGAGVGAEGRAGGGEDRGRRAVLCIYEGASSVPVMSCSVGRDDAFTLDYARFTLET